MQNAPTSLAPLLAGIPTHNTAAPESFGAVADTNSGDSDFAAVLHGVDAEPSRKPESDCELCPGDPEVHGESVAEQSPTSDPEPTSASTEVAESSASSRDENADAEVVAPESEATLEQPIGVAITPIEGLLAALPVTTVAEPDAGDITSQIELQGTAVEAVETLGSEVRIQRESDSSGSRNPLFANLAQNNPTQRVAEGWSAKTTSDPAGPEVAVHQPDESLSGFEAPTTVEDSSRNTTAGPRNTAQENTNPLRTDFEAKPGDSIGLAVEDVPVETVEPSLEPRDESPRTDLREIANPGRTGRVEDRLNPLREAATQVRATDHSAGQQPVLTIPTEVAAAVDTPLEGAEVVTSLPANVDHSPAAPSRQPEGQSVESELAELEAESTDASISIEGDAEFSSDQTWDQEAEDSASPEPPVSAIEERLSVKADGVVASLFAGAGIAFAASESETEEYSVSSATTVTDVSNAYGVVGSSGVRADQTLDQVGESEDAETVAFETLAEDTYETIMDRVELLKDGETDEIELQIDPPELGRLHIRVSKVADEVSARITVIDPGTFDMLHSELNQLRDMLDQSGVPFSSIDLQQQSAEQQQHTGSEQRESNGRSSGQRVNASANTSSQLQTASARSDQQAIDILA